MEVMLVEENKRKRGRPSKSSCKHNVVAMRIADETANKLNYICESRNISKADMLKKWVDYTYKMMENGIDFL